MAPAVRVDLPNNSIIVADGRSVRVASRIADLVSILVAAMPSTQSMDQIIRQMAGWNEPNNETTIRVFLSRANKALDQLGYRIENVRGRGWRIEASVPEPVGYDQA